MQDRERHDIQDELLYFDITQKILKCCFEVINTLGTGFLESFIRMPLLFQ